LISQESRRMPCGSEDIKIIDYAHRASTALWGPPGADRVTQPDVLDERGRRTASAAIQAIPIRNEALPQGKIRKTTKSALGRKRNDHVGRQFPRPRMARAGEIRERTRRGDQQESAA
jgi:hypothetical protein